MHSFVTVTSQPYSVHQREAEEWISTYFHAQKPVTDSQHFPSAVQKNRTNKKTPQNPKETTTTENWTFIPLLIMRREREWQWIPCFIWRSSHEESVFLTKIFLSLSLHQRLWLWYCRLWKCSCFSSIFSISSICLAHLRRHPRTLYSVLKHCPLRQRPLSHHYLPDHYLAITNSVSPLTSWEYCCESFTKHRCNNNCRSKNFFPANVVFRKQRRDTKKYSRAFSKLLGQGWSTNHSPKPKRVCCFPYHLCILCITHSLVKYWLVFICLCFCICA